MSVGITLTQQVPASAIATVTMDDRTPTALWHDLVAHREFQRALVEAIRVSATGKSPNEFRDELADYDLPPGVDDLAVRIAGGEKNALFRFTHGIERLGEGWTTTGNILATPALLEMGERTPTIAVRVRDSFFERRAGQRRDMCELVAVLARACDVRLVGSGIEHRRLARLHRADLPGVSEQYDASRPDTPEAEIIETARTELGIESREVRILRLLAEEPAETLSYHALESRFTVSASRIRQCVSRLADLSLIASFNQDDGKAIELLNSGRAFIDALDADIGRQADLDSYVSETGNSRFYCRVSPQPEMGEGDGPRDRRRVGTAVNVEYLPRWRHAATVGCATDGGITLVDRPETKADEQRQMFWSYDEDADRVVVGAEYTNPMQWWVCVARALASRPMFDRVLTPDRLDGDVGNLAGLLTDDLRILRDGRCLGYLKDAHANGEDYGEALQGAEEELCKLTAALSEASGDEERRLRSVITREALGLAGTIAHLLDLAGVDLVREVRLPEFTRCFDADRRDHLAETIARGAAIQSSLGHFAAYRQLFEDDPKKRGASMTPDVDASDPHGRMIGSFVLVGDNVSSFESTLSDRLRGLEEVHEDAPEFDVGVPVRSHLGRPAYAQAVRETLAGKRLSPTRESISIMMAFTNNPYDVAAALGRGLAADEKYPGRAIRANECRVALRHGLDAERILPDAPPSASQAVSALLTATEPLSKTDLADRADVSTRSLRTHLPMLEALGLVEETPSGYRLLLSFAEESGVFPPVCSDGLTNATDLLFDALTTIVGDAVYDFDHPIGAAFATPNPPDALLDADVGLKPWIHIAVALAGPDDHPDASVVRFGPRPSQAALPTQTEVRSDVDAR